MKTTKHQSKASTKELSQRNENDYYEEDINLQDEAMKLFADMVVEVGRFPKVDPEEITRVWLEAKEKLYHRLLAALASSVDGEARVDVLRLIMAIEVNAQTFSSIRERAKAYEQVGKALREGLSFEEIVFRLLWCLAPDMEGEMGGQNVSDKEAEYIFKYLDQKAGLGLRSISRVMNRSTETIHRTLRQNRSV